MKPSQRKLAPLEKAILKLRAYEMVCLLHEVERLKALALGSVQETDRLLHEGKRERLPDGTKGLYKKLWQILINEDVITTADRDRLEEIIDTRNQIGHSIHTLVADIAGGFLARHIGKPYDHGALRALRHIRTKIEEGLAKRFIMLVGLDELVFEQAGKLYEKDAALLEKRIVNLKAMNRNERTAGTCPRVRTRPGRRGLLQ